MNLVFGMDGVISTPCRVYEDVERSKPITNAKEFMDWLRDKGHHITIWCVRPNTLEVKLITEQWLQLQQVPYDRLLFDRPKYPIFVDETPPNAKYRGGVGDNSTIAMLFEEWKEWYQSENMEK